MMILAQTVVPAMDPIGLPANPWWFVFLLLLMISVVRQAADY